MIQSCVKSACLAIVTFIYFEKATKFQKSSNCFDDTVKTKLKIFQFFVSYLEYMNFEKRNGRSNIYIINNYPYPCP